METTLIQTKLQPPDNQESFIKRPYLTQRLQQNPQRHLTLVSAPAGFGKTSLITAWLAQQNKAYTWVSLDPYDDDIGIFLRYVTTAIRRVLPEACPQLSQILLAPDLPTSETLATIVINELSQLSEPILLVLDDYHVIHNKNILQLIERILSHASSHLHLVIMSRVDPLLPLPRLRLQQQMVEIRRQDLRFSDEEAQQFLQTAVSTQLNPDEMIKLNHRVEGWVAGLRLASLSLQKNHPMTATSSDSTQETQGYIANYLFLEVLAQQPQDVQEFLLQTAFVNRFNAGLCQNLIDIATEQHNAQTTITYLQRANLFIISLDETGEWFRYHHLFQQMLQQQATIQLGNETIRHLHHRAGDYFAQNGLVDEALQHYLDGDDLDTAVSLIEDNSHNLLNSLARQNLERRMALLPDEIIWERPRLLIAKAWLFYRHWQLSALANVLDRIETCLQSEAKDLSLAEVKQINAQLHTLKSVTAYCLANDFTHSFASANQALSTLPQTEQGALGTALGYKALSLQAEGEYETAVSLLQKELNNPAPQGPAWVQLFIGLSFIHLISGELLAMNRVTTQFLALSQENPLGIAPANWVSGIYFYEKNQLASAHEAFAKTANLHYSTNFIAACDSWLGQIRIYQEQGKLSEAQQLLTIIQTEALRLNCQDILSVIEAAEAYQAHLQNESAIALRWASTFQPDVAPDYAMLSYPPLFLWARILAAHDDKATLEWVQITLKTKLTLAQENHNVRQQVQLLTHLTLIEMNLGREDDALASLRQAIELANLGGFIRSFLDCGSEIRPLLEHLHHQEIAPHYTTQLLAEFATTTNNQLDELILTNRETEILQMMQTGQSNKEIAQNLVISLYTVKRHASNIYRKLDVNGRRQAILQAQQLGILQQNEGQLEKA